MLSHQANLRIRGDGLAGEDAGRDSGQLYSFRHASTNEPAPSPSRSVRRRCFLVDFRFHFRARLNPRPAPPRSSTPCRTPRKSSEVALSPDGTQVAYIVDDKLTVTSASGGSSQTIAVEGNLPLRDVAWSADSKRIAFIADLPGDVPSAQLWTAAADGSAPAKHAELKGYVQAPRFSPDGSKLAILFIEGMPRVAGPLQPMTPLAGVIDQKIFEQRIATIDLSTDHLTQVTPADVYVYEYDWTPDGQAWAATAAHGTGDANWWIARLYLVNARHWRDARDLQAEAANRRSASLSRRKERRIHRRIDERRGFHRRRHSRSPHRGRRSPKSHSQHQIVSIRTRVDGS